MTANRDDRLDGKVVLVTGAGSRADGIGNGRAAVDPAGARRGQGRPARRDARLGRGDGADDPRRGRHLPDRDRPT